MIDLLIDETDPFYIVLLPLISALQSFFMKDSVDPLYTTEQKIKSEKQLKCRTRADY